MVLVWGAGIKDQGECVVELGEMHLVWEVVETCALRYIWHCTYDWG